MSETRFRSDPSPIRSSWDDLLAGIDNVEDWRRRKETLRSRYLQLIRDDYKPAKAPLELKEHESVDVDGAYVRQLISYNVEPDERAHAYLAIPHQLSRPTAGVVTLHGTHNFGKERLAGLTGDGEKALLDHLARRGYVVIAPDHFVAGHRIPAAGAYRTDAFYSKHPDWTAVGKSTYEHSIAVDVLQSLGQVDAESIGVLGHSLGGHGAIFLAAYDERIAATACNCAQATFRHNPNAEDWARDHFYVYFKHIRNRLLDGELPPIDFHEIVSLISPRPFLDICGLNDADGLAQRQRTLMNLKIMDVYELQGAPENFAFYCHGLGHSVSYHSRHLMYAWMDKHLKHAESTRARPVRQGRLSCSVRSAALTLKTRLGRALKRT